MPWNRDAREHRLPHQPTAEHELSLAHDVGRDHRQGNLSVLESHVGAHASQVSAHSTIRQHARERHLELEEVRSECIEVVGDLGWVVTAHQEGGYSGTYARADDVIEVQAGLPQNVDHTHVRVAANASSSQREPDLEPGQIAGCPAELPSGGGAPRENTGSKLVLFVRGQLGHLDDADEVCAGSRRRIGSSREPATDRPACPVSGRRMPRAVSSARSRERGCRRLVRQHENLVEDMKEGFEGRGQRSGLERLALGSDHQVGTDLVWRRATNAMAARPKPSPDRRDPGVGPRRERASRVRSRVCHATLQARAYPSRGGAPASSSSVR